VVAHDKHTGLFLDGSAQWEAAATLGDHLCR
jgi:hypothetical protein